MIAYYAPGGGLGHIKRAGKILSLKHGGEDGEIWSTSCHGRIRHLGQNLVERPLVASRLKRCQLSNEINERLQSSCPTHLYIDTFPSGIMGELTKLTWRGSCKIIFIGRRLKWQVYQEAIEGLAHPAFHKAYRVEPLEPAQISGMTICSPFEDITLPEKKVTPKPLPSRTWLITHSGPYSEVASLVRFAREHQSYLGCQGPIAILSPCQLRSLPEATYQLESAPSAEPYFQSAHHIITACGFNIMEETKPYRHKQLVMPMPRRFDDQFWRASLIKH